MAWAVAAGFPSIPKLPKHVLDQQALPDLRVDGIISIMIDADSG